MLVFGWTIDQIAFAKKRHQFYQNIDLPQNTEGIIRLQRWWDEHNWPAPLSVKIDGVEEEKDTKWAIKAAYSEIR